MKTYEERIEIYQGVIPEFRFLVFVKYEGSFILSGKKIRDRLAPRHKSKIISKTIINDLIRFRRENEPSLEDVKKFFGVVEAFIEKSGSINEVAAVSKAAKGLKQQAELRLVYFGDGGNIQTGKQYRLLMPKSCRVS